MNIIHKTIRALLPILFFCLLFACRQTPEAQPPRELLRVDGRTLTLERFEEDFAATLPGDQPLSEEQLFELRRSYLLQAIDRELVVAEAERLGLSVSEAEEERALQEYRRDYPEGAFEKMLGDRGLSSQRWRRRLKEELLMEKAVGEAVYSRLSVSDEEVAAYHASHPELFDRPAQVRALHILVASEEEGNALLELLHGGASFAELAREHSLSPDGEEGGDLGFFARGEMPPEFDETVFNLPAGALSEIVESDYGFHIFLVEEHRDRVNLSLDQVREELWARLLRENEVPAYQRWLQELRGRASIEINWELLQPLSLQ